MDKISVNPFIYHVPISCFNKYWLFVATITIFPIRLFISINFLICANLYSAFIIWLFNVFDLHRLKQIEPVRNLITLPCLLLLRLCLFTAGIFRLKVNDKSNLISDSCLNKKIKQRKSIYLISPHVSFLDLIALILVRRNSTFLMNFSLNKFYFSFLFKNVLELLSFKMTKRTSRCEFNGKHSLTIIQTDTLIRIKEAVKYNDLIVYPEGITTSGKCLLKYKLDVFYAGENVIPVNLIYNNFDPFFGWFTTNKCNVNSLITTQFTTNYYKMIWLTLCQVGFTVDLNISDVYVPNHEEIQNTELFTENVRALVGRLSGHFLSKYTFDDVRYFRLAKETNTPRSSACIKLLKLCYKVSSYIYASSPPSSPSLSHNSLLTKSLTTIPEQGILEKTSTYQNGLNNNGHLANNHSNGGTNGKTHRKLSTVKKPFAHQSKNEIFISQLEYMVIRSLKNIERTHDELSNVNQLIEILDFDNINYSNNLQHANELYSCLDCTNISPLRGLIITLLLCNTAKPNLWDRIFDCFETLSEDDKYITIGQFQCLLWFLLGLQSEQLSLNEHSFGYEKITFTYLRKNLCEMFQNSVRENAEALLNG